MVSVVLNEQCEASNLSSIVIMIVKHCWNSVSCVYNRNRLAYVRNVMLEIR